MTEEYEDNEQNEDDHTTAVTVAYLKVLSDWSNTLLARSKISKR